MPVLVETQEELAEIRKANPQDQRGIPGWLKGQPKQKYWTPDGREILSSPSIHGQSDGSTRDANLDKGWLLVPPTKKKLYCPFCQRWHDTKVQITTCGKNRSTFVSKHAKKAISEFKKTENENETLRQEVAELKELVNKLLKSKGM